VPDHGAPLFPDPVWERLRRMLEQIKAERRSCRVVVVLNVRAGVPLDGDVLATDPPPVVHG